MKIIILGPQGSGKGTQAQMIAKELEIPHISTGDIFRENIQKGTELGKMAQKIMNKGQLISDDITFEIVKDRLSKPDCQNGYVLDGFPRNIEQAKMLEEEFESDKAVNVEITDEESVFRIAGRRTCPDGHVYHVKFNPPKQENVCDLDGKELLQREDDKEETIKRRLEVYHTLTKPVIEFYKEKGKLIEIDGMPPIDKVFEAIKKSLF